MKASIATLLDDIQQLPKDWHHVGSIGENGLRKIAKYAHEFKKDICTVETGSGKSTLLFSQISTSHLVFSIDDGESMGLVRNSPLFKPDNVTFVEGLTQVTLPQYTFKQPVQIALIDGPHAYPFPDLEYYYLYPILEPGGILLLDDIKIPTIGRMFDIIKVDAMFELLDIVDCNLAIFRRTSAPCPSLLSDGWCHQGYNRAYYDKEFAKFPA